MLMRDDTIVASVSGIREHCIYDLMALFQACFEQTYQTRLVAGDDEPVYLPASAAQPFASIVFAHGFFSSALHECAHWFVAGPERRQLEDYGYWYVPDGRTVAQQALFCRVEVKPQAIECLLSEAAGFPFRFSFDNLSGEAYDAEPFKRAVFAQAERYRQEGLPWRAAKFYQALKAFYTPNLVSNSPNQRAAMA